MIKYRLLCELTSRHFIAYFFTLFLGFLLPLSLVAQIDVRPVGLPQPESSIVCKSVNSPVIVEYKSNTTDPIDLSNTPLKFTVTISGAKSGVLTGELTNGVIYTTEVFKVGVGSNPAFAFDVAGVYTFKIKTSLASDTNASNDEITVTRTFAPPLSIPYFENCNSDNMYEWRFDENPGYQCFTSALVEENGNKFVSASQSDCGYAIFTLPQVGKIRQGDVLSFDYKVLRNGISVSTEPSSFNYIQLLASTDCGRTFQEFHRINGSEHVLNDIFVKKTVSLASFVGQDVKIRFVTNTGAGNFFDKILLEFDNFSINTGITKDLGVIRMENVPYECDNATQALKVKIKNFGTQNIDFSTTPTTVTAKVTGTVNTTLTKTLSSGILTPESTLDLTLDGFLNMSALRGRYNVSFFTALPNDGAPQNDTLKRVLASPNSVSVPARALPFNENFDNNTIPAGWNGAWTVIQGGGRSGNSIGSNVSLLSGLVTPRIGTIRATDRLSFDVKITNLNNANEVAATDWGRFVVSVSNDCGYSYEQILLIDKNNLFTGNWRTMVAPLSTFVGQNIFVKIATISTSDTPYRIEIDNFSIASSPLVDLGMLELINPETNCENNAQTLKVKIRNFAGSTLNFANNPATVTAQISGAINQTFTKQINSGFLLAGDTMGVSFDGVFDMSLERDYFIKTSLQVSGDGFDSNDTIFTVKRRPRKTYNLPFEENFDSLSTFPLGWILGSWQKKNGLSRANGQALALNMNGTTPEDCYLPILKTVGIDDNLVVRYAVAEIFSSEINGDVYFEASSDCGLTYQLIHQAGVNFHAYGQNWQEVRIPLSKFIGSPISIRIKAKQYNPNKWVFAVDDIRIEPIRPIDVACDTVYLSEDAPPNCGSSARTVALNFRNYGSKEIDFSRTPAKFTLKMSGMNAATLTKTLNTGILEIGGQSKIVFDGTVNTVEAGLYRFSAYSSTLGDITFKNDTTKTSTIKVDSPFSGVPYRQNFDTLGLPKGWSNTWGLTEPDTEGSRYVTLSILDENSTRPLTSPSIGRINTGDKLVFDYRVFKSAPDWGYFKIFVSTLCGEPYTEVLVVSDSSHIGSGEWVTKSVSLSAFSGNNVNIQIIPYFSFSSYQLQMDNVLVQKEHPIDIVSLKTITPLRDCGYIEQEVSFEVQNLGSRTLNFAQTPLTAKAIVTGRLNETLTKTINSGTLAPDARLTIQFDRKINTIAEGAYRYQIMAQVAGDGNTKNDTLTAFTRQVTSFTPLPFRQNFDSTDVYPLTNWQVEGWRVQQYNSQSAGKIILSQSSDRHELTLPKIGLVRVNDAFDFDYNVGVTHPLPRNETYWVEVEISDDCGYSFFMLHRIILDIDNGGGGWQHFNVPLSNYVGKAVIIRLKVKASVRVEAAFDNILINNIRQKDVSPTIFYSTGYAPYCGNPRNIWHGEIKNTGNEAIDLAATPVTIKAIFTGTTPIQLSQVINTGTIAPLAGVSFDFELDMSRLGVYSGQVITQMAGDINPQNDTLSPYVLDTRGAPLPFFEDFDGLSIVHPFTSDHTEIALDYGKNASRGMRRGLNADKLEGYLEMPQIGTIRSGDVLNFDCRVLHLDGRPLSSNWGKITVKVTTDCNATFTEIYTIDSSTYTSAGNWLNLSLSLSPFAGKSVVVIFDFKYVPSPTVAGFYAFFDNFSVKTATDTPPNDECVNAIILKNYETGHQGTTLKATSSSVVAPRCNTGSVNDVWYKIVAPTDVPSLTRLNILLSNIQTRAVINYAIFKGNCTTMSQLDSTGLCGSTSSNTTLSLVNLEQEQTYFLRIWSKSVAESGNFTVRLGSPVPTNLLVIANANTLNCRPLSTVTIRQDNNQVWVPIMDGGNIVAEIKANGNNLGRVQTDYFINKTGAIRRVSNTPFLDRNVGFKLDTQPRSPVSVRIYLTNEEWTALRTADPSVSDTSFSLTRIADQTCTNSFTAVAGSAITGALLQRFNGGYYIQFNTAQFSQFFIHNNRGVLKLNTNVMDMGIEKMQVYPIPTNEWLTVEVETNNSEVIRLDMEDIFGRRWLTHTPKPTDIGVNTYSLNVKDMPTGTYFLVLTTKKGKKAMKVVKSE
jgi:hypothetical protein